LPVAVVVSGDRCGGRAEYKMFSRTRRTKAALVHSAIGHPGGCQAWVSGHSMRLPRTTPRRRLFFFSASHRGAADRFDSCFTSQDEVTDGVGTLTSPDYYSSVKLIIIICFYARKAAGLHDGPVQAPVQFAPLGDEKAAVAVMASWRYASVRTERKGEDPSCSVTACPPPRGQEKISHSL
jgi:hypothetical protein